MNMTFQPARSYARAYPMHDCRTFSEAAASYIEHGGEKKYLNKILPHIGEWPLDQIFTFDIRELAKKLLPRQSNATRNRCVVTPIGQSATMAAIEDADLLPD